MTDNTPRGFVQKAEYLKLQRRVEELEELVDYYEGEFGLELNQNLVQRVRAALQVSPQQARIIIACARSSTPLVSTDRIRMVAEIVEGHHVNVLVSLLNKRIRERGGPQYLIRGKGGVNYGGRGLTPEGRTYLQGKLPELFERRSYARAA